MPKSPFIIGLILLAILPAVVGPASLVSASAPIINFVYVPPYGTPNDPIGNTDKLTGEVHNVNPDDYVVAVYIYVFESWWTKPYNYAPITPITKIDNSNGTWVCDIVTDELDPNGDDEHATQIVAFLIPKADLSDQIPPILLGSTTIPSTLDLYPKVEVTRTPTITNIFKSIGAHDGWILESSENSGVGGTKNSTSTQLYIGDDAANRQYLSILSFDTSTLPDNAFITKAMLKFKHSGFTGTSPFTTHGNLLVDVRKGAFSNALSLQLGDFNVGPTKFKVLAYTQNLINGWYMKSFLSADFNKVNKTGPTQFRLRFTKDDNNDLGADFLKIYSGNAGAANRPQLVIEYYVP